MLNPTQSKLRRAARAFTLLEILIAIAILGLLVGLAVADLGRHLRAIAGLAAAKTICAGRHQDPAFHL